MSALTVLKRRLVRNASRLDTASDPGNVARSRRANALTASAHARFLQPSLMIDIRNVTKSFGAFRVLDDCTASVAKGSVVVVCGPSGSGKSTLIRCINGLEQIDAGEVIVDGISVHAPGTDLNALRARVGMVFQSFELFPHLTVLENVDLAQMRVLHRQPRQATERSMMLLERVGLADQAKKYPSALSGGQQQRIAIARALAMDPVAMLFDEPTSALDPEMISEVLAVMTALAEEGMTMIVVTHEMAFARHVAHRMIFMDRGRIVENRETQAFFAEPQSERAREFLSKILHHDLASA